MATAAVDPGDATAEAIPDWHYWVAMGLWLLIYAGQPKTHHMRRQLLCQSDQIRQGRHLCHVA
jgi:hypothetical protein